MTASEIEKIVVRGNLMSKKVCKVVLYTGETAICLFVECDDFETLKKHNAWRIVKPELFSSWNYTGSAEFTSVLDGDLIADLSCLN